MTKIILGVSLVELSAIVQKIRSLATIISRCYDNVESGFAVALALIIYFAIVGFLSVYLLSRIYLPRVFRSAEEVLLEKVEEVKQRQERMESSVQKVIDWWDDPHEDYAPSSENDSRKVTGWITPPSDPKSLWHSIKLTVESKQPDKPVIGRVVFLLHPTFSPDKREVQAADGKATIEFKSKGVFTVGVQCDDDSKLAIDLCKIPGGTAAFYDN